MTETTGLTSSSGSVTDSYTYDAFGATKTHTGTSTSVWKFTGEQNDTTVNQSPYYLRARYYDPVMGRFFTRDPFKGSVLSPDSLNAYAYADNDPAVVVDPWGLCSKWPPNNWGDCPQKAAQKAVSEVKQGLEGASEYLSDQKHLEEIAQVTQMASQVVASYSCAGGPNVLCGASLAVYAVSTLGRIYMADNAPERAVLIGTGVLGACTSFMPTDQWTYKAASWTLTGISDVMEDLVSNPGSVRAPASGSRATFSGSGTGLSCPAGMVGEKYANQ